MDIEENPRRRRRRKAKKSGSKSGSAPRRRRRARRAVANPAPRRRRARRARRSMRANPAPRRTRRRARRASARRVSRRRSFRRNPAMPKWGSLGVNLVGGGLVYGADMLVQKAPIKNTWAMLGARSGAAVVLTLGSAFAGLDRIAAGAAGGVGFMLPGLIQQGYAYYQATQAAKKLSDAGTPAAGTKGLFSVGGVPLVDRSARAVARPR